MATSFVKSNYGIIRIIITVIFVYLLLYFKLYCLYFFSQLLLTVTLITLVILPETINYGLGQSVFRKGFYKIGWVVATLIFSTTGIVISLVILIASATGKLMSPFLIVLLVFKESKLIEFYIH